MPSLYTDMTQRGFSQGREFRQSELCLCPQWLEESSLYNAATGIPPQKRFPGILANGVLGLSRTFEGFPTVPRILAALLTYKYKIIELAAFLGSSFAYGGAHSEKGLMGAVRGIEGEKEALQSRIAYDD